MFLAWSPSFVGSDCPRDFKFYHVTVAYWLVFQSEMLLTGSCGTSLVLGRQWYVILEEGMLLGAWSWKTQRLRPLPLYFLPNDNEVSILSHHVLLLWFSASPHAPRYTIQRHGLKTLTSWANVSLSFFSFIFIRVSCHCDTKPIPHQHTEVFLHKRSSKNFHCLFQWNWWYWLQESKYGTK